MADWRAVERRTARLLGATRTGNRGKAAADVQNSWLVAECKTRRKFPTWLTGAMRQAVAAAEGRLPVVVLHEHGARSADDLVVVRMADFVAYFGGAETPTEGT